MEQATQQPVDSGPPSVLCFGCGRPTLAPVPITLDKASGPSVTIHICDRCAHTSVARHQILCPLCRAGVNCGAADAVRDHIRQAADARRAERQARR